MWDGVDPYNFRIQRKIFVECRGLPFLAWSEQNLKCITKDVGLWEEWVNENSLLARLENSVVCIYSNRIDQIEEKVIVSISGKAYEISLVEKFYPAFMVEGRDHSEYVKSNSGKEEGLSYISKVSDSYQKEKDLEVTRDGKVKGDKGEVELIDGNFDDSQFQNKETP
ncbi:hypothetical protein POM88_046642 [Heracleum sosnowskyi]|uniref:DUF4283 domain-containing protein n=1 Tax=Heracleum sosnowskyi TaxID=360622 RepID=A0AAD8H8Z0_9APIA|nr:hypothetical protein POM88_046642 [Heracleum sosnowskyi]